MNGSLLEHLDGILEVIKEIVNTYYRSSNTFFGLVTCFIWVPVKKNTFFTNCRFEAIYDFLMEIGTRSVQVIKPPDKVNAEEFEDIADTGASFYIGAAA